MALTIDQVKESGRNRQTKVSAKKRSARNKSAQTSSRTRANSKSSARGAVRSSVKPWSKASSRSGIAAGLTDNLKAEALQKWMEKVIDRVFDRPMPAFLDREDIKKKSGELVNRVETLIEKGVEQGQTQARARLKEIRDKNPVLNELIDVAQKQFKKAQGLVKNRKA